MDAKRLRSAVSFDDGCRSSWNRWLAGVVWCAGFEPFRVALMRPNHMPHIRFSAFDCSHVHLWPTWYGIELIRTRTVYVFRELVWLFVFRRKTAVIRADVCLPSGTAGRSQIVESFRLQCSRGQGRMQIFDAPASPECSTISIQMPWYDICEHYYDMYYNTSMIIHHKLEFHLRASSFSAYSKLVCSSCNALSSCRGNSSRKAYAHNKFAINLCVDFIQIYSCIGIHPWHAFIPLS